MFAYTKLMQAMAAAGVVSATDPYFNLTTLLLPGNGTNGAQNNTFLDSSSNNFTITRNGNTTQGTFSPFSQTGWGVYFNGTTDYLTAPTGSAFQFAGDFCVEGFCYPYSFATEQTLFDGLPIGGVGSRVNTFILVCNATTGTLRIYANSGYQLTTTITFNLNAWNHWAIMRNGSTLSIFINGVRASTATNSTNFSTGGCTIGRYGDAASGYALYYASNLRITNGSTPSGYSAANTSLTVPTSQLTAISGTSFLTCQSNRFVDNSTNALTITPSGTPSVQAFSPFAPTAAYSAATNGGSGYFDGTGDCLALSYNAALVSGGTTNAFTVDFWYYLSSSFTNGCRLLSFSDDGGATGWDLWCDTANILYMNNGGTSGGNQRSFGAGSLNKNEWTYIRLVSDGTNFSAYRNGSRIYTVAGGFATSTASNLPTIGARRNSTGTISDSTLGYISNVRVVKGGALNSPSDTTISIPTAPFTTTVSAGTANLLLNFTNAGITDATAKNALETVGNAQISTTQSKFGGGSMYFDGTGDYLTAPWRPYINVGGSTTWTIEFWGYVGAAFGTYCPLSMNQNGGTRWGIEIGASSTNLLFSNSVAVSFTHPSTLTTNTWFHYAITRDGTTVRLFINGVVSSTTSTNNLSSVDSTTLLYIGRNNVTGANFDWNGYIDDLRITIGQARYTSTFTPPTAAFQLS